MSAEPTRFAKIPAGWGGAVNLTLRLPGNAPLGSYEGSVRISSSNAGEMIVPITVTVDVTDLDCRVGNVNFLGDDTEDVLLLNGSAGTGDRIVEVGTGEPIELSVLLPSSRTDAGQARFRSLYVWSGEPTAATAQVQPFGLSTTCMPTPLGGGGAPVPIKILNNIGRFDRLGTPSFPSTPAPFSRRIPQGLSRPIRLTLQGFIQDDASQSRAGASITNAILLRVE